MVFTKKLVNIEECSLVLWIAVYSADGTTEENVLVNVKWVAACGQVIFL